MSVPHSKKTETYKLMSVHPVHKKVFELRIRYSAACGGESSFSEFHSKIIAAVTMPCVIMVVVFISVFKKSPQIRLLTAYARILHRVANFA